MDDQREERILPVADDRVRVAFDRLWDHLVGGEWAGTADAVVCFGCRDRQVPIRGAELFAAGAAPLVVATGGNPVDGGEPEAEWFARTLRERGVPADRIVVEPHSTNTGENVALALDLLARQPGPLRSIAAVSWPLAGRRVVATVARRRPSVAVHPVPALGPSGARWPATARTVRAALGEWDRLERYGRAGWLAPQPAGGDVHDAVRVLRRCGVGELTDVAPALGVPAGGPVFEAQ